MRKTILKAIAVLLLSSGASTHAVLLGDNVKVQHYYQTLSGPGYVTLGSPSVVSGPADTVSYGALYSVNLEDSAAFVDFGLNAKWSPTVFSGLFLSSLNIEGGLLGLKISTNLEGWSAERASFTATSAKFNWQDLSFTADSFFNVSFRTAASPVPDGGATFALLGGALVALGSLKRFRN